MERGGIIEKLGLAAAITAAGCGEKPKERPPKPVKMEKTEKREDYARRNTYFDAHPEFFAPVPGGEFSKKEKKRKTETLKNGEVIFRDHWMTAYRVEKGDTKDIIKAKLARYPEFAHVADCNIKEACFNILDKDLEEGMLIPIPLRKEQRYLSDEQFANYALQGIQKMLANQKYGPAVKRMVDKIGYTKLVATIVAIAKQEAGGAPLGEVELHRFEPAHGIFSYSYPQILDKGAGRAARASLSFTPGQTYHPKFGTEMSLAFLCEKYFERNKKPTPEDDLLPLEEKAARFASFYNGKGWRKANPDYVKNLLRFYNKSLSELKVYRSGDRLLILSAPDVNIGGKRK